MGLKPTIEKPEGIMPDHLRAVVFHCPRLRKAGIVSGTPPDMVGVAGLPSSGNTPLALYIRAMGSAVWPAHNFMRVAECAQQRFVIFRDPRDVVCSHARRLFREKFADGEIDTALMSAYRILFVEGRLHEDMQRFLEEKEGGPITFIRFEDYFFGNEAALVDKVAQSLGLELHGWFKEYILWEFSLERNRQRMTALQGGFGRFDTETHIHGDHITSGKVGAWRELLTPRVAEEMRHTLEEYMDTFGYAWDE